MNGKINKILLVLFLFIGGLSFSRPARAEDDPRVKVIMQEGLRLYSEKQYIKALDLFKQVLRIDPANNLATQYVKSSEDKIREWESGTGESLPADSKVTWDNLLGSKNIKGAGDVTNAKDIIAARKSLVDRMRNRSVNTENIVKIQVTNKGMDVILYHDQLFLPGLLILRDEALPVLEKVGQLMREKKERDVTILSMAQQDSSDPFLLYPDYPVPAPNPSSRDSKEKGEPFLFQDIEATRSFILFTYLAQESMAPAPIAQP